MVNRILGSQWTKVLVFLLCLIPVGNLAWGMYQTLHGQFVGALSANPVEYITHKTGDWILRFLLLTLAITPLRMIFNKPQLTRYRRMLGLFAFFYAILHFTTWFYIDKQFVWGDMVADVFKRPYITVGMLGFLIMVPLAITSTAGWVRRLGYKRWQKLHKIVYIAPAAGVVHYWWLVKSDITLPRMYGILLAVAMAFRIYQWTRPAKPAVKRAPAMQPVGDKK